MRRARSYRKVDAGFGGRRLETQIILCAGRLSHFVRHEGYSKVFLEVSVQPLVEQFLQERGLELSEEKTTIMHIQEEELPGISGHLMAWQ
jgi:RNA-directed DNA polymerase